MTADLANRHHLNGAPPMTLAPDHGAYTDELDAMTLDELLRVQRLLSHEPAGALQMAVTAEIRFRVQMRDGAESTGGAA